MPPPADREPPVVRNDRRTRLLHTALFLVTSLLLVTGWWIWTGQEGTPSALARLAGRSDVELHQQAGWVLAFLGVTAVTVGVRGTITSCARRCGSTAATGAGSCAGPRAR